MSHDNPHLPEVADRFMLFTPFCWGRDSSVGIATRYSLECPGIESRWGRVFPHRPDRPWGPPSLLYNEYRVFPVGKAAGAWCWPPTSSNAEIKERVELYIYSSSGHSQPVLFLWYCGPVTEYHIGYEQRTALSVCVSDVSRTVPTDRSLVQEFLLL
jgi:hypothetical protein